MQTCKLALERATTSLKVRLLDTRLDASVAESFFTQCHAALDGAGAVHVDLGNVRLLDSAGIGALAKLYRALGDAGTLTLHAPSAEVRAVLEITRLDQVFRIDAAGLPA